jgi:hypothetical protein
MGFPFLFMEVSALFIQLSVGLEVLAEVVMKSSVFWGVSTGYSVLYPRRQNSSFNCCFTAVSMLSV